MKYRSTTPNEKCALTHYTLIVIRGLPTKGGAQVDMYVEVDAIQKRDINGLLLISPKQKSGIFENIQMDLDFEDFNIFSHKKEFGDHSGRLENN